MNGVAFAGPTAGFLLGFVAMAWAAGFAAERGLARGLVGTALSALLISAALYIPGVAWPALLAGGFGLGRRLDRAGRQLLLDAFRGAVPAGRCRQGGDRGAYGHRWLEGPVALLTPRELY